MGKTLVKTLVEAFANLWKTYLESSGISKISVEVFGKFKNFLKCLRHLYETLAIKNISEGLEHL